MPRHKKTDPTTTKSQVIRLRVTEAEAEQFKINAIAAGCNSISEYIRRKCIEDSVEATATAKK